jgi:hypothetical protein
VAAKGLLWHILYGNGALYLHIMTRRACVFAILDQDGVAMWYGAAFNPDIALDQLRAIARCSIKGSRLLKWLRQQECLGAEITARAVGPLVLERNVLAELHNQRRWKGSGALYR